MKTYAQYKNYKKPTWAPPAYLFAPVWTVLYILIAVSFGYVFYQYTQGMLSFAIVLPFLLNLFFNLIFSPIQFGLRSMILAAVDIVLILATLIWFMITIFPIMPWVIYIHIPYLMWVLFATVLQLTITWMNR
jgi:tryptophan-rich sensory protein